MNTSSLEKNLYNFAFSTVKVSGSIDFDIIIKNACSYLNSEEVDGFGVADVYLFFKSMELWIKTAPKYKQNVYFPTEGDLIKSSLFKRISSGKLPLDEPPPCCYSYPW